MSQAVAVARNAALLMFTNAAQKLLSFIAFAIVADIVGKQVTGEYFHIVSITSIFVAFTDLGLTSVIIRESAQSLEKGRAYFGTALSLKAYLIPASILAAFAYGWSQGLRSYELYALVTACFVMTADTLSMMFYGMLRGKRDLRFESLGLFIGQCLSAGFSIFAAIAGWGAQGLIGALLIASCWNLFYALFWTNRQALSPEWGYTNTKELIRYAIPFGLSGVFVKVYSYIDSQIIHHFHGDAALGEYAVAYKMTYALQFLPMAFVAALYPSMSHAAKHDKGELQSLLMGSLRLMLFFGVGMSIGLSTLASVMMPLVFGQGFTESIAILQVLAWVLIPIFLDFPIGSLLNSTHRAGQKTTSMGVAMVINALLNLVLIPKMGAIGAAWSANASFIALYGTGLWFVRNEVDWKSWLNVHVRGVMVGILSVLGISMLVTRVNSVPALVISPLIYLSASVALGILSWQDMTRVLRWLKQKTS